MSPRNSIAAVGLCLGGWLLIASGSYSQTATPTSATLSGSASTSSSDLNAPKAIVLHKPLIPAAWGQVIQYSHDTPHALFDRDLETVHEFVLKGQDGIFRVARYHEPQSGAGFWEVWVWDLP